jgi:hypothetical protein
MLDPQLVPGVLASGCHAGHVGWRAGYVAVRHIYCSPSVRPVESATCPLFLTSGREVGVRASHVGPGGQRGPGRFASWALALLGRAAYLRLAGASFSGVPMTVPVNRFLLDLCVWHWLILNLHLVGREI